MVETFLEYFGVQGVWSKENTLQISKLILIFLEKVWTHNSSFRNDTWENDATSYEVWHDKGLNLDSIWTSITVENVSCEFQPTVFPQGKLIQKLLYEPNVIAKTVLKIFTA